MAAIDITTFGGVAPSVDPRELGPGRAQIAQNLDLRYGDFRPTKGAGSSVTTVTSGSKALFRTPDGTWLSSTNEADFANGQINDTTDERVYLTGRTSYPEAWDGSYRRLGVRAPTAAPVAVLSEVDEYTLVEQQTSVRTWVEDIKQSILDNYTVVQLGNPMSTLGSLGAIWLAHGATTGMPTTLETQIVYATPISGGVAVNATDQYLLDPSLHGVQITYLGVDYWAIPITWFTYGYDIDESALATELKTFLKPPEDVDQLIPDDVADQMAARIGALSDPAKDPLAIMLNRVNAAQSDVYSFLTRVYDDPNRKYAVAEVINRLAVACRAVDNYYINFNNVIDPLINEYAYVVPVAVEREFTTRTYVYTYVTDWGEESAPSPPSDLIELDQNDTVDLTVVAPPTDATYGDVALWRLYRSATTNEGAAYEFVAETAIGTLTYNDSRLQEELGPDVCQTMTWTEPRADMENLCAGANGIMAGSVGKILCLCEPYTPYAWPREFEQSIEHNIVAVKTDGQSFVVLTEGEPFLVSGADSAQMSVRKLDKPQACVSKRSATSVAGGVIYASPDGVCLADVTGVQVLTLGAFSKDDWAALTPSQSFATFSEGVYYLWLTAASQLLTLDFVSRAMTLSPASGLTAAHTSLITDTMYAVSSTSVLPQLSGSAQTGTWESGIYSFEEQPSFAWARVNGDFTSGTLTLYADGSSVFSGTVAANTPVRLPATRGREWSVKWADTERAVRIIIASSTAELTRRMAGGG